MMLSDVSVKRPVFATVISLLLVAFGAISFNQLSLREYPDVDPPVVGISTRYSGASAAVVETRITQIIESRIAGVPGIKTVESTSRDGRSNITVEFGLDRNIDDAANDIRDRVSRVLNNLPEEADPPEVSKADADTRPIIYLGLTSPNLNMLELTDFAERVIVDRLSVVDGVARVNIFGQQRYAIRIYLDRQAMAARNVTVEDIEAALRRENVELPAGKIESIKRDTIVRINREYSEPDDFKGLVLGRGNDGGFIRLGDVALVELGAERDRQQFRGNGQAIIGIGIEKQSTANTLDVANQIRAEVGRINETIPDTITLNINFDSSVFVSSAITEVYRTLFIAMMLVVLVLYLFLGNLRTVIVPAITVPVCVIATFWVMNVAGVTINLITLLGIVMAIGLVVDDAIVVLENIYRRVEDGEPGLVAAYNGARQVGFAVIATTLVLISVFLPIMFLSGNVGRLFGELAITMSAAVLFSSLVALSLCPMLCSKLVRRRNKKPAFAAALDRGFKRMQAGYVRLLEVCLNNKPLIVGSLILCFVLIAGLMRQIPSELAPMEDRGSFFLIVRMPEGAGYNYAKERAAEIEENTMHLQENGELHKLLVRVSAGRTFGIVILKRWGDRERSSTEIAEEMRKIYAEKIPGAQVVPIERSSLSSRRGSQSALQFVIGGDTYADLGRYAELLEPIINTNPNLTNVDFDYKETQPQLRVQVDRTRAADLGVSIQTIGRTLESMMGGRRVTTYVRDGKEYDVILRAQDSDRMQPMDMENIYVRSARTGTMVPLNNLVNVTETSGAPGLRRFNRVRALTISASMVDGYSLGEAVEFMQKTVTEELPEVTMVDYKGAARELLDAGSDIYFIFALALVVVFLVLAAQFESFIHPLVIMVTVPLAVLGGVLGLYLAGSSLNIYSQLGMIMLIGLAAKNGILIVEFSNQLRDEGLSERDALLQASATRLRPIMMTGMSTAMGAVPLMMAFGAGSASRQTIGVVVFGGVMLATILTLFVVPVFYDMLARYTRSPGYVASKLKDMTEKGEGEAAE